LVQRLVELPVLVVGEETWQLGRAGHEWGKHQLPEILPDFIQGWYLFMGSGLDVMERNVLHAELRGDFGVRAVEEVLRKHWTDADLRKRDAEKGRYMSNLAVDEGDEPQGYAAEWSMDEL